MLNAKIPPPIILILSGLISWAASRLFSGQLFSPAFVMCLYGLAVIGFCMLGVSVFKFIKFKTTVNPLAPSSATFLVTTGVYKVSRNPMYLAMLLVLLGWVGFLSVSSALVGVFFFVAYIQVFQIWPEEKALEELFGEDYRQYKKAVRPWM